MDSIKDRFDNISNCLKHGIQDYNLMVNKLSADKDKNSIECNIALTHSTIILDKVRKILP